MDRGLYAGIRRKLVQRLPDGLILLSGASPCRRNGDVEYPFRQNSDFLYLTGVPRPHCRLLIDPRRGRETLFIPKIDNHYRIWLGDLPGPAEAKALYGFKRVFYNDRLPSVLKAQADGYKKIYADAASLKLVKPPKALKPAQAELRDALDELRAVKASGEIALLRKASEISSRAHLAAMRQARAGQYEYEVQAVFEAECLKGGLKHLGYPSIVAAGRNAAVLHYQENDAVLKAGELLLIDAAAEAEGYSADITRTFPIGPRFSPRQKDIYALVLEAQRSSIDKARPGLLAAELHLHSMRVIARGLKSLGILKGDESALVEGGAVRLFYPHGIGHMLGLDGHDSLGGKRRCLPNPTKVPVRFNARLEPFFVITVEPGVYFHQAILSDPKIRRRYRSFVNFDKASEFLEVGGVRIEDDVVVQPEGAPLNLTSVPKDIDEIESIRAEALESSASDAVPLRSIPIT